MKNFNKSIIAVLLMTAILSGCGSSPEMPGSSSEIKKMPAEQSSAPETDTVAEATKATTSAETTTVATTISIEDRKPKVNQFTKTYTDEGVSIDYNYCFVPEEATELSDDVNLGLITVDGKEFDITALGDAYGEEEIKNIFGEQAGLYTTERLIADGVFDDVYIATKGSPFEEKFIFGESKNVEEIEVNQGKYGLAKSKGAYDFITVEYVNGWFRGLHTKCLAMNAPPSAVEQITVNGEEKPFVEVKEGDPSAQLTTNEDKLITYTDKNIAIGDGTTFGDIVTMFGAEPTYVDVDFGAGNIYTYRNSDVTVGFVTEYSKKPENLNEEERSSSPIIAFYLWLND